VVEWWSGVEVWRCGGGVVWWSGVVEWWSGGGSSAPPRWERLGSLRRVYGRRVSVPESVGAMLVTFSKRTLYLPNLY
jgi:hypothetical protein